MLKISLVAGRAQYFVSLASKTRRAEDDGDTRLLFKLLAEPRQFNPRCSPTLCDAAGDPVAEAEAGTKVLEEHFTDAMCAVEVSSAAQSGSVRNAGRVKTRCCAIAATHGGQSFGHHPRGAGAEGAWT